MSVSALSPSVDRKRLYEAETPGVLGFDTCAPDTDRHAPKRGRRSPGRHQAPHQAHPAALHPGTLHALRGLFPGMDDQTVTAVLQECGNDIDAAIRRLNQLRIAGAESAAGGQQQQRQQQQQQQQAAGAARGSQPAEGTVGCKQPAGGSAGGESAAAAAEAAAAATAACETHQQPAAAGQQRSGGAASTASPAAPAPAQQQQQQQQQQPAGAPAPASGLQTADEWVGALVSEMAAASSIPDARARAAKLLHAFEGFTAARLGGRGEELARENAILKRAVQIQNARMQEAAARDAELGALKQAVAQYQERCRSLELSNYSLALHLQKATGQGAGQAGQRPPDVF